MYMKHKELIIATVITATITAIITAVITNLVNQPFNSLFSLGNQTFSTVSLSTSDWIPIVLLGAGPMGAAFYTWDAALKRGDPRVIGSLAYITPLTSTLILVLLGGRQLTWISGLAMALIVVGAIVGSWDLIRKSSKTYSVSST